METADVCVLYVQALSHKLQTLSNELKREQGEQGFMDYYLLFSILHNIFSESCPNPIQNRIIILKYLLEPGTTHLVPSGTRLGIHPLVGM